MDRVQDPSAQPGFVALNSSITFLLLGIFGYTVLFMKENERAHITV